MILDEPPKPPTQCELRHAIGVLKTQSAFFADDAYLYNLRKSTGKFFLNHRPEFAGCKA